MDEAQIRQAGGAEPDPAVPATGKTAGRAVEEAAGGTAGEARPAGRAAWVDWLTTTDHKKIGTLYLVTALVFFSSSAVSWR
ncbi:hypothetical protein GCM10020256_15710 [Streptomyces thermocoprophilus]